MQSYEVDNKRLLQAVDCIVRDVDKKYDECLVDHFMSYLQTLALDFDGEDKKDVNPKIIILERLKCYFDHKAFVMMNQARAYKTLHAIIKNKQLSQGTMLTVIDKTIKIYLDSFWATVGNVIVNDNLAATTVFLSILEELANSKDGFVWVCEAKLTPELKLQKDGKIFNLSNVIDIVDFYLIHCNNYHTRNKTKYLLKSLIDRQVIGGVESTESVNAFNRTLTYLIENLIKSNSISIMIIISQIVNSNDKDQEFLENFNKSFRICDRLYEHLVKTLNHQAASNSDLDYFCKCIAQVNSIYNDRKPSDIFKLFLEKERAESAIIYLSNIRDDKSVEAKSIRLYTVLSPISHRSTSVNHKKHLKDLCEKLNFHTIENRLITDKLITTCILNLNKMVTSFKRDNESLSFVKNIIVDYISENYKLPKSFKNIMESCDILKSCSQLLNLDHHEIIDKYLIDITKLISSIDRTIERTDQVIISLIGCLKLAHKNHNRIGDLYETVERSLTNNHEIINEFLEVLISSQIEYSSIESSWVESCLDLLWSKVHRVAQSSEHLDLLGNLYQVLSRIDQQVSPEILSKFKIEKSVTIPNLVKDYVSPHESEQKLFPPEEVRIVNATIIDDIINYELISDGIIDCY